MKPGSPETALNKKDKDGFTPAMLCCLNDAYRNLELLLRFSFINLNETNKESRTAEDIALNYSEQCKKLLDDRNSGALKGEAYEVAMSKYIKSKGRDASSVGSTNDPKSQNRIDRIKTMLSQVNENFKIYGILAGMSEENQLFTDEEFPADVNALVSQQDPSREAFKKTKWMRPQEVYQREFSALKLYDRVAPEDIDLGSNPDSSFGIALQVLSEFPTRLIQSIINKEVNKNGIYSCKYHVLGLAAEVYSDDLYPCNEKGEFMFLKNKNKELWQTVLEKSAAKFYGCYKNTQDGLLDDLFEDILGVPCTNYELKKHKSDKLYELLSGFVKNNYIAAVSTLSDKRGARLMYKIQDGHYVIDVYEEQGLKLVKLRAPTGKVKGKKLNEQPFPKDKFYIALPLENAFAVKVDDLPDLFDVLSVAFYNENWQKNYISLNTSKNHAEYISINVMVPTKIYIVVNQESIKLSEEKDYQYSDVQVLLAKEGGGSLTKIACGDKGPVYPGKTLHIDQKKMLELEPGKYVLRIKTPWKTKDSGDVVITTYSDQEVHLDYLPKERYTKFLEKFYIEEGRTAEKYDYGKSCYFTSGWEGKHFWLYMLNDSSEKTWVLDITFNKMGGVRMSKRFKLEGMSLKSKLGPRTEKLVYLKGDQAKADIGWEFKHSWE